MRASVLTFTSALGGPGAGKAPGSIFNPSFAASRPFCRALEVQSALCSHADLTVRQQRSGLCWRAPPPSSSSARQTPRRGGEERVGSAIYRSAWTRRAPPASPHGKRGQLAGDDTFVHTTSSFPALKTARFRAAAPARARAPFWVTVLLKVAASQQKRHSPRNGTSVRGKGQTLPGDGVCYPHTDTQIYSRGLNKREQP